MGEIGHIYVRFYSENVKERRHLGDLGADGGNIKLQPTETMYEGVDWIHLARDGVQ
jgi:hypothetical protein